MVSESVFPSLFGSTHPFFKNKNSFETKVARHLRAADHVHQEICRGIYISKPLSLSAPLLRLLIKILTQKWSRRGGLLSFLFLHLYLYLLSVMYFFDIFSVFRAK